MRRLGRDETSGSFAVDFALILPLVVVIFCGVSALAIAFWKQSILQAAAGEAARCIALAASACASTGGACGSADQGVCYAVTVAASRGLADLTAAQVTVDRGATLGTASVTSVAIAYPFSMFWVSVRLTASAAYPNAS
ncbi:TadE/TadG family type IV pilus assembly protein [Methylobacterium sp. ID0610]|uniref:TadE/TadG family type IV pilus assembly protein n=1 Tax=Methylobacterium carpenticola TaxID=3344827 RepID=UPI0036886459